ncbi:hypothetical protein Ahy_B10g105375 [Arachis hypogaea]|uniref:Uncharacterized protein n=1 Tax=Arachis hypogaea TaxID=3818 RepID=A0A444X7X5_ARAHY|nr:hypothetical protein Ahy_B10g105375 [Arachis hypogaea]
MQQAELLSSLAQNIDTEDMDQSLENTWKVNLHNLLAYIVLILSIEHHQQNQSRIIEVTFVASKCNYKVLGISLVMKMARDMNH